jgi:hypothetical protein
VARGPVESNLLSDERLSPLAIGAGTTSRKFLIRLIHADTWAMPAPRSPPPVGPVVSNERMDDGWIARGSEPLRFKRNRTGVHTGECSVIARSRRYPDAPSPPPLAQEAGMTRLRGGSDAGG